jgi:hypothetical protein
MKAWLLTLLLLGALAQPAAAESKDDNPLRLPPDMLEDLRRAEEAMKRGLETMRDSVDLFLRAVPQYDWPRMNEDGDIIIKRRKPEENRGVPPRRTSATI